MKTWADAKLCELQSPRTYSNDWLAFINAAFSPAVLNAFEEICSHDLYMCEARKLVVLLSIDSPFLVTITR